MYKSIATTVLTFSSTPGLSLHVLRPSWSLCAISTPRE